MGTVTDSTRLFIVAQDDDAAALAALAQDDGWAPVVDTGGRELVARALASGAAVILVDGRKAPSAGLAAVRALGGLIAATGAALLVLTDDGDTLDQLYAAGATHFLRETGDRLTSSSPCALRRGTRPAIRASGAARRSGCAPIRKTSANRLRPGSKPGGMWASSGSRCRGSIS
ncbi:hypothetical protein MOP88_16140 [Sphingomonas sp. WKB10]|nr:hypothetical protein [Sphingomonas sp. WKB10]